MPVSDPLPAEPLPPKPQRPEDSDCCRGDCALCVFDRYERQLERWEQAVATILARREPPASHRG